MTAEVHYIQLPIYGAWYKNILKNCWGQKSRRHYKLVYILIIGAFLAAAHIYRFRTKMTKQRKRNLKSKKKKYDKGYTANNNISEVL